MFYMKKEFTASVYLIENQNVLLLYHPKLQKWVPPGGHVEPNETPSEAARREVREETGIEMEFILQENISINYWNAKSIERPYLCLLEEFPPYRGNPAHQHIDFIFIGRPVGDFCESTFCRWFKWEDLQELQPDIEIFNETLQIIQHLFQTYQSLSTSLQPSTARF